MRVCIEEWFLMCCVSSCSFTLFSLCESLQKIKFYMCASIYLCLTNFTVNMYTVYLMYLSLTIPFSKFSSSTLGCIVLILMVVLRLLLNYYYVSDRCARRPIPFYTDECYCEPCAREENRYIISFLFHCTFLSAMYCESTHTYNGC